MKVRTFLLFACMVVVPGLAMFSHRVPADVRSATRCALWDPIQHWAEGWSKPTSGETVGGGGESAAEAADPTGPLANRFSDVAGLAVDTQWGEDVGQSAEGPAGRLAALGVSMVECRPLDSQTGRHVASCRVAIDASGQLHRVFQAAGGSPQEAVLSLADQVEQWRDRLAVRSSSSESPSDTAGF